MKQRSPIEVTIVTGSGTGAGHGGYGPAWGGGNETTRPARASVIEPVAEW
jgi:hypothetical protein